MEIRAKNKWKIRRNKWETQRKSKGNQRNISVEIGETIGNNEGKEWR
jgi:hypothetical protein